MEGSDKFFLSLGSYVTIEMCAEFIQMEDINSGFHQNLDNELDTMTKFI